MNKVSSTKNLRMKQMFAEPLIKLGKANISFQASLRNQTLYFLLLCLSVTVTVVLALQKTRYLIYHDAAAVSL